MESEEFLNQMIETLGITVIDKRSRGIECDRGRLFDTLLFRFLFLRYEV